MCLEAKKGISSDAPPACVQGLFTLKWQLPQPPTSCAQGDVRARNPGKFLRDHEYDYEDDFIDDSEMLAYLGGDRRRTKHSGFFINKARPGRACAGQTRAQPARGCAGRFAWGAQTSPVASTPSSSGWSESMDVPEGCDHACSSSSCSTWIPECSLVPD